MNNKLHDNSTKGWSANIIYILISVLQPCDTDLVYFRVALISLILTQGEKKTLINSIQPVFNFVHTKHIGHE